MTPRVSVLIPTFNRAIYILLAVNSVLAQTFSDLEVIVVDDGSTDRTADKLHEISDPRVHYIYQNNRGVAAALNTACRAARGEYLARLDSDDIMLPNHLAELVPILDTDRELALVYGRAQAIDSAGGLLSQLYGGPPKFPGQWLKSELYADCVCTVACLFRRSCLEQLGGFNEALRSNEDWDLMIRMSTHWPFFYCNQVLTHYRLHSQGMTAAASPEQYSRVALDRVALIENYYGAADIPPAARQVQPLARRNVYMDATIRFLAIGRWREAFSFFSRTVRAAPDPVRAVPRVIGVALFHLYLSKSTAGVRLVEAMVSRRRANTR